MTGPASEVIVVTGAASGIGFAVAQQLGRRGSLIIADINQARLDQAAQRLREAAIEPTCVACDIADPSGLAVLVAEVERRGRLRTLVHSAGLSASMAPPARIVSVNLIAAAEVERAFLPLAVEGSSAVFVASIAADRCRSLDSELAALLASPLDEGFLDKLAPHVPDGRMAYQLSKWGVRQLCERRCSAWAERGARIVSVSPGYVDTPMVDFERNLNVYAGDGRSAGAALGRSARADEVAALISFVTSDAASYITGCDLRIDGGLIAAWRAEHA